MSKVLKFRAKPRQSNLTHKQIKVIDFIAAFIAGCLCFITAYIILVLIVDMLF